MLKLWMIKGPLQFLFVALISFPLITQIWYGMSWFTVAFVLIFGCSLSIFIYMPQGVFKDSGSDQ